MAQWDIHRARGGVLVLDIQSDLVGFSDTRVVVPLVTADELPSMRRRLTPVVLVGDRTLHAVVLNIAAIPASALGPKIATASDARDDITRALDMVLGGV